jgi:hypothetical protein
MLSETNGSVRLGLMVEVKMVAGKSPLVSLVEQRTSVLEQVARVFVEQLQALWAARVREAEEEVACRGCGVLHRGQSGWVQRGRRERGVRSSAGTFVIPLHQVTCRGCGKTRTPWADRLGVEGAGRYLKELRQKAVETVCQTSYARSASTVQSFTGTKLSSASLHRFVQSSGAQVKLTPDPDSTVMVVDGTKVPAGRRADQEEMRMAFQLQGRSDEQGRPHAHMRLVGFAVGPKTWPDVLRPDVSPRVVVTDAEPALCTHVRNAYPAARHQLCEWHVVYTLDWSLITDRVPVKERKRYRRELSRILFSADSPAARRRHYRKFREALTRSPTAQRQLQAAEPYILFDEPSPERTTSLVERQMREINRRVDVGARWSVRGVGNLVLIAMTRRHNPDDYRRVWN